MNDLISRQAAIEALCKMQCGCKPEECGLTLEVDGAEECADVRFLMKLPSAEKHGEWIDKAVSIKGVPTEACSECGEWSYGDGKLFCPNCGAQMERSEESD